MRTIVPYYDNLEAQTLNNNYYRKVVYTDNNLQLVYMSLLPGEEIGFETHPYATQFIRIEEGEGLAVIDNMRYILNPGYAIIIPPNALHNIINTSNNIILKLYTLYSPPQHSPNTLEYDKI